MTRHSRYFLFGSVAVLLVGLCTGLVAYYAGLPMGAFGQSDTPAELAYVPPDAAVVAYADVQEVMQSDLRDRIRKAAPDKHEGQAEFERETGINIERDIDHVVAFLVPGADEQRYQGMVLAAGRFDATRLEGLARKHGGEVEEYKGKRLISRPASDDDDAHGHDVTVAFLSPGVIGVGDTASIKGSIDRLGAENVTQNDELMDLIRDIDGGNAWAVGRFDALMSHARLPEGVTNQIPAIRWFSASGQVNGGVNGMLRAEARDEVAGQNLRDVVQGFLALARLQAGSKPEMQALVNSLQISGTGKTVALSFSVPAEVFAAFPPPPGAPAPPPPPRPPAPAQ
jgi:hypothetical protein